jgi:RNA polymerase sigma factor (sigma-70 family)
LGNVEVEARLDAILKEFGGLLRRAIAARCPKNMGLQIDDIVQEACLRLWRVLSSGREIHDFPSYLHRVAATVTIDAVRRVKGRHEEQMSWEVAHNGEIDEGPAQAEPIDASVAPEVVLERKRLMSLVNDTLARLPANRRRAVGLYLQGWNSQDIAELMGWSEAKARNLVYRGLGDLRGRLRDQGFEYEIE